MFLNKTLSCSSTMSTVQEWLKSHFWQPAFIIQHYLGLLPIRLAEYYIITFYACCYVHYDVTIYISQWVDIVCFKYLANESAINCLGHAFSCTCLRVYLNWQGRGRFFLPRFIWTFITSFSSTTLQTDGLWAADEKHMYLFWHAPGSRL